MLSPEGEIFDPVFPVLQDLLFELGNVPGPPVVGASSQSQVGEHGGPLRGASIGGVEGNDAPCDEIALLQVDRDFGARA